MIGQRLEVLERRQRLPLPAARAFDFYAEAMNLEAITPPWLSFRVVSEGPLAMREGALIDYRLKLHGVPIRWRTRIAVWDPPRRFVDVQVRGPYALWEHTHTFTPVSDGEVEIADRVRYRLPLGPLGRLAHAALVRRDLQRIFDFRVRAVERELLG